jgi:4'-phosphopantetheinyl transferase
MDSIYPVVLPVPEEEKRLAGRQRVSNLSRLARRALGISAEKSGLKLGKLSKDENGAPLPCGGIYWSLTHKPDYVGGVVSLGKIGIDIEKIRPCSPGLFKKTAQEAEWRLLESEAPLDRFFRCWTAKEAVIKAAGTGIRDLLRCSVAGVPDDKHLLIEFRGRTWLIEHSVFDGHMAAVVKTSPDVRWTFHAASVPPST